MIRRPRVEGKFYPGTKATIINLFDRIEKEKRYPVYTESNVDIIGAVLPHAGHIYSGHQTIPFFKYFLSRSRLPETIIILNPNHKGIGPSIALDAHSSWQNSLGIIEIDKEINDLLPYPKVSEAQENEHSAEVLIPYIQHYFARQIPQIVPICMKLQEAESSRVLAQNLFSAINSLGKYCIVIASSDFSHFLTPEKGSKADQLVLDMIENRDIVGLKDVVDENMLTICGYGPIMSLMAYSELTDRNYKTRILARGHSGEVHFSREVVNYISILFSKGIP